MEKRKVMNTLVFKDGPLKDKVDYCVVPPPDSVSFDINGARYTYEKTKEKDNGNRFIYILKKMKILLDKL
jgi:hypothetical protein